MMSSSVSIDEWQAVANIRLAEYVVCDASEANSVDHVELRKNT